MNLQKDVKTRICSGLFSPSISTNATKMLLWCLQSSALSRYSKRWMISGRLPANWRHATKRWSTSSDENLFDDKKVCTTRNCFCSPLSAFAM